MNWPEILVIIAQGIVTVIVGFLSFKQKKTLDKFTLQKEFMLELSRPFYADRIEANKTVFAIISVAIERAEYFGIGVDEYELTGYAKLPGFNKVVFSNVHDLFVALVEWPYGELQSILSEHSSSLHPDIQTYIDKFVDSYSVFYKYAKSFKNGTINKIETIELVTMKLYKTKILSTMQNLYKQIDILNK